MTAAPRRAIGIAVGAAITSGILTIPSCSLRETEPSGTPAFSERVVVFLLADSARIAAARAGYSEDDFAVIADDMLWYRAEAWRWFEEHGITVHSVRGRPPLSFRVAGVDRPYDFSDDESLDLVILYEPGSEPLPLPTADVATAASVYFD